MASAKLVSNLGHVDPYFSGRSKTLAKLKLELDKTHVLQVNGISGVGKTALVTAFAHCNKSHYDVIWWINGRAEALSQCTQFLKLIEKQTGNLVPHDVMQASEDGMFTYVLDSFKNKRVLLIVDDVQSLKGVLLRLVHNANSSCKVDVLLTSQKSIPEINALRLESLPSSDSSELVYKFFPHASADEVNALANKLHHFPIALSQALRYMKFNSYDIPTYLDNLRQDEVALHGQESKFIHKHKGHLAQWDPKHDSADLVIKQYLQNVVSQDENLGKVLYILPFLSQQYVSKKFLNGYLKYTYNADTCQQSMYGKMLETGLLMPTNAGFYYHEIIKYITPSETVMMDAAEKVGDYLLSLMAGQEVDNFPADEHGNREYIDQVQSYLDMCQKLGLETETVLKLRILMSYYREYVTRSSTSCLTHVLLVDDSDLLKNLPNYYQVMHRAIACKVYFKTSAHDKKDADAQYKKFLATWKNAENDESFNTMKLRVLSVIMSHLLMRQRTDLVEPLVASGDDIIDQVKNPFQKLCFTRIKCWYLNELGKASEADKITDEMWPLFEKTTYGSLKGQYALDKTISLIKINNLEKAAKYARIALDHFKCYFGNRVVDLKAEIAGILGNIYVKQHKYIEAKPILEQSILDFRKAYEKDGQVTWQIEAKLFLSQCLLGMGKTAEALEKAYEVEYEFDRLVGDDAKGDLAKKIYVQIIRSAWLAKQPGIAGRYLARYDDRFGESLEPKILPKLPRNSDKITQ